MAAASPRLNEDPDDFLALSGVGKVFGRSGEAVEALRGVSLAAPEGVFLSLLGPSGCGKSTLLMMLAGLEAPSSGSIRLQGRPVAGPRRDVGIVFQDPTLLPWRSVLDNVLFPARILKLPMATARERALNLLDSVGLADFAGKKPHELSGGMRQRVALCRALVHDPAILLMDEPFSALDAITRDQMAELLAGMLERYRKTVVFVTHSIREAVFLSDRVVVMTGRPGAVAADIAVPYPRPRRPELAESVEFNALCGRLRRAIETEHGGRT
jgi:NitT/TauT family transport system ATP-binding protein